MPELNIVDSKNKKVGTVEASQDVFEVQCREELVQRYVTMQLAIWRGGMTVFGPSPRSYAFGLSKKSKKIALKAVLTDRLKGENFTVIDSLNLENPKTKEAAALLAGLGLPAKTLFIVAEKNANLQLAVRNLPRTDVLLVDGLNVFDLLAHEKIVCTPEALKKIEERLN